MVGPENKEDAERESLLLSDIFAEAGIVGILVGVAILVLNKNVMSNEVAAMALLAMLSTWLSLSFAARPKTKVKSQD